MFDWNDEELANIIWGEQGETDDHTVPYPEGSKDYRSKKEWSQETTNIGPAEQNIEGTKGDIHGKRLGCSSNFKTINDGASASGFGVDSLPGSSESSGAKTDQESMGPCVLNNLKKYDSSRGEASKLGKKLEIFHRLDENKEQGDLIDYEWANIGSFNDFNQIFGNDDPLFDNVSIGNADELWYSSKGVISSPLKSFPISANSPNMDLANTCEPLEIKKDCVLENEQSMTLECGSTEDSASLDLQNALLGVAKVEYPDKSKLRLTEQKEFDPKGTSTAVNSCVASENIISSSKCGNKVYWANKMPKDHKRLEGRNVGKELQDPYGTWSPSGSPLRQSPNQLPPSVMQSCPSSCATPQQQLQGPQFLQDQHVALMTPSAYGNHSNADNVMPVLSHVQSAEFKKKPLLSGCVTHSKNANFINKSADLYGKHLKMSPHEKIVKLRRRQQMQAMLAIQKLQQQFSHQVSSTSHSMADKSSQGSGVHQVDGNDAEVNKSALPFLYSNSPVEQDASRTISNAVEDTILYQLQDIIAKLDIRIRLCIRDSLLRLAQSAMQRHHTAYKNSTSKTSWDERRSFAENKIVNHVRYASVAETETETNSIDRTVAYLLFHSRLELSEKYLEPPESPASIKASYELKNSVNTSVLSFSDSSRQKHKSVFEGSAIACPATEQQHLDHLENNPCVASSYYASNHGPADGCSMEAAQ